MRARVRLGSGCIEYYWEAKGYELGKVQIGFFWYTYVWLGKGVKLNSEADISVEKYINLINPANIDPSDVSRSTQVIRRRAPAMPAINIDKRATLGTDVEQGTILAASLYADYIASSSIGRNLNYIGSRHLHQAPSQ